jgi:hypothetical protein
MGVLAGTQPLGLHVPVKFGRIATVYVTLLITAGVPSVVTAESTAGISVADTAAGRYTVTFDGTDGRRLAWAGGSVQTIDATPTGGMIVGFTAFTLDGADSSVEIQCISTGSTLADPETLSKVRFKMEIATL